ncbi:hypothetical protein GCM10027090_22580 [Sinomonas soli]
MNSPVKQAGIIIGGVEQKPTPAGREERRAADVAAVVAKAPPLTPAQRDRVAALLRPSASSQEVCGS